MAAASSGSSRCSSSGRNITSKWARWPSAKAMYARPTSVKSPPLRAPRRQRLRKQPVSFGRESGQQTTLAAEVMRRRGMRDPGPSRQVAKAHGRRPGFEHRLAQRIEEGAAQVSMVVSRAGSSH
jgi:hypothetical protein